MQVAGQEIDAVAGEESKPVTDARMEEAILKAMSDEASRLILKSATVESRSIEEIVQELGVPASTAYRRVHELVESGLLLIERVMITGEGRRYLLYRSAFREMSMTLESGELSVRVSLNEDVADRFHRTWQSIRLRQAGYRPTTASADHGV